ncbi:CHASE domain-containing protein, partial [Sulfitobacter sp.]|uniref:CHASE domain-containing protein n=1 Tax=Sulfitobacter sp. TaxID=1903071 RepID=UPI003EF9C17A
MRTWLINFPRAIPAALFLAVAAITALSVYAIESNAQQRTRAEVQAYAGSIASALDRRGNSFSSYLRAGAALFSTGEEVGPQTFRRFVAELQLDQTYRGAEGIGWTEVIRPYEAEQFLERVRINQPAYPTIRETATFGRDRIAPVTYFSPDTVRNRRAIGFDMYSEPARAAAMDEAQRTVMPTASGRIALAQEGSAEASGFAIFMPVYKTVAESPSRERELAGYLFSSFNAEQFLDAAIDRAPPTDLGVRLYDGGTDTANLLVSRSLSVSGVDRFEQPVRIANRDLLLVVESAGSNGLASLSMITLLSGLGFASLLMLVARLLATQATEDQVRLVFLEEQHSIRNSLSRELNHRVKNTLANVLSILSLTRRRSHDLDEFADSLDGRIRALSATHDL